MALGDSRRASGAAMEQQRRAIGTGNEAARRAIGAANEASRRGTAQIVDDLNRLTIPAKEPRRLRTVEPRGLLPAKRGTGNNPPTPIRAGTGGGIASPLTEVESSRIYFEEVSTFFTNDYLLMVEIQPLQQLKMTDADGQEVVFNYKVPPTNV
ncbi:hypothetical protein ACIGCM_03600 [Pseudomonas sp. NPDC078700]|uniref:hypothetical protein n=1 Tax=Pseudomonas sp. NPDC078700 TaxID=3364424 RepID=UPI0037C5D2C6